jgi:hypothetical protein
VNRPHGAAKALLPIDSQTFIEKIVSALAARARQ